MDNGISGESATRPGDDVAKTDILPRGLDG